MVIHVRGRARAEGPYGLACIIAPACWHKHRYPIDCYRFYPDGMIALCKWAGLKGSQDAAG